MVKEKYRWCKAEETSWRLSLIFGNVQNITSLVIRKACAFISSIILLFSPYLMENDNSMLAAMVASWSEERERERERAQSFLVHSLCSSRRLTPVSHHTLMNCSKSFLPVSPIYHTLSHVDSSDLTAFITCDGLVSFCSGPFGHMHFTLAGTLTTSCPLGKQSRVGRQQSEQQ